MNLSRNWIFYLAIGIFYLVTIIFYLRITTTILEYQQQFNQPTIIRFNWIISIQSSIGLFHWITSSFTPSVNHLRCPIPPLLHHTSFQVGENIVYVIRSYLGYYTVWKKISFSFLPRFILRSSDQLVSTNSSSDASQWTTAVVGEGVGQLSC